MRHLLLLIPLALPAADWYVSEGGSDSAAGTSTGTAFRTLARAATAVGPGDTVWAMDGSYANSSASGDVVALTVSGTASAWISWKALPGHKPELRFNGWNGFKVAASYQVIDGFTITGCRAAVTLAAAQADAVLTTPDPRFNGTGITIDGRGVTAKHHHITIRNCVIRDCTGGGISAIQADYITVEDCRIADNAWYGRYAQSGISLYQLWNFDAGGGHRNAIRRNLLHRNRSQVPWTATGALSDGNGIIIDDSKNTQNGSTLGAYGGRTLVSGNVVLASGGSGIHAYQSAHVDIVNNTTCGNGTVVGYAEIFANASDDVAIRNNIMVARSGGQVNTVPGGTGVVYADNIYHGALPATSGGGDQTADPLFLGSGTDPASADLRISALSPALDSATVMSGTTPATDRNGTARPLGGGLDRGAYERPFGDITAPAAPAAPTVAAADPALPTLSGTTEAFAAVLISDNGVQIATVLADAAGRWSWTATTALASGTHAFTVVIRDASGNVGTASAAATVTVPATPTSPGSGSGSCGAGLAGLVLAGWAAWVLFAPRRRRAGH